MSDFERYGQPERLIPWSQIGYVLMLGLALAMIAAKSDMNPKLRAVLRNAPVIGSYFKPASPDVEPADWPGGAAASGPQGAR